MTYKQWLNNWLENYVKPTAKDKTYTHYQDNIRLHIIPRLGNCELEEITPLLVQQLITELLNAGNHKTGSGLSENMVNSIINVIQLSLETAFRLGIAQDYEMDKLKRPRVKTSRITCFTPTEQKKIERVALADKRPKMRGIVICLYTGLRIGEILSLEWSDIDFKKQELTVCKTCHDANGGGCRVINTPKTETSNRVIPLPKQIIDILRGMKKESSSSYVVTHKDKPVSVRSYQRSFELLLKKQNIPHRGFHSLRHTFATRALECGMDIKTLSEILGHKSPTITLNRYVHSMTEHKREMMKRVGRLL